MTKRNELISTASELIASGLERAGMKKRKGDIFTQELSPAVLGWVGLNRAFRSSDGVLEINPVIGLRHQEVEKLLATLLEENFHPYAPPTISIALGYLTPERRFLSWFFKSGEDQRSVAENIVTSVIEFGFPFMAAHSTLSAITNQMEAGTGIPPELAYRLPIAYLLMGDSRKLESYLSGKCAELGNSQNAYALRYQNFASKLRAFALSSGARDSLQHTTNQNLS